MATRAVLPPGAKSHPHSTMMQTTLPVDSDDDDGNGTDDNGGDVSEDLDATTSSTETMTEAAKKKKKKRGFSMNRPFAKGAEKIPALGRSLSKGAEKIPALGRSSSATASATASRLVSRMAPMLRRVVSGTPSTGHDNNDAAATADSNNSKPKSSAARGNSTTGSGSSGPEDAPANLGHNFLDSSDDEEQRDSLLFMIQVPRVRRKSHIPLMSFSHAEE